MTSVFTGAILGADLLSALVLMIALASVGSVVTFVIIVVANRAEPDPTGNRTSAIYHVGTAFVTLWLEIVGVIIIFATLFGLIGAGHRTYFTTEIHPLGDATIRGITIGVLLSVVGGLVTVTQRRQALALAQSDADPSSASQRIVRSYGAVVSFISVIVMVLASLTALGALLGLIAPGVYDAGSRTVETRALLDEATVVGVFAWVYFTHQRLLSPRPYAPLVS